MLGRAGRRIHAIGRRRHTQIGAGRRRRAHAGDVLQTAVVVQRQRRIRARGARGGRSGIRRRHTGYRAG